MPLVDAAGRRPFDGTQYVRKSEGPSILGSQCGEEQVCVIRHDDSDVKVNGFAVIVEAMSQCESAVFGRELQASHGAESYE